MSNDEEGGKQIFWRYVWVWNGCGDRPSIANSPVLSGHSHSVGASLLQDSAWR